MKRLTPQPLIREEVWVSIPRFFTKAFLIWVIQSLNFLRQEGTHPTLSKEPIWTKLSVTRNGVSTSLMQESRYSLFKPLPGAHQPCWQDCHSPLSYVSLPSSMAYLSRLEAIKDHWDVSSPLTENNKFLATKLQQWYRDHFGLIEKQKKRLWARLAGIQTTLSNTRNDHLIKL